MSDLPIPPDWVLHEAAKRCDIHGANVSGLRSRYTASGDPYRALCDMIAKHEQKPVDRKLLCAREAATDWEWVKSDDAAVAVCVRAIELWEEGFGK